ncbi:hypothetical protein E2562_020090 [Oryza meyeriana var. granulata]|uniref:Uncharacterized protein n=1 Tax=Oryza meyeriana var. granulata TaxID=110450 RepID=A0A6G1EB33_9ORYZ|nr:hypothetical protein E2562_020090 [Oryza meyeriana var. granulata]
MAARSGTRRSSGSDGSTSQGAWRHLPGSTTASAQQTRPGEVGDRRSRDTSCVIVFPGLMRLSTIDGGMGYL